MTTSAEVTKTRGNLTTNGGEIAVNWALDGHGILMRAEWDIRRHLASGRLVQVLPQYSTPDTDIYTVYPPRHQLAARARAFVDFLALDLCGDVDRLNLTECSGSGQACEGPIVVGRET